jgi:hypothetical protein
MTWAVLWRRLLLVAGIGVLVTLAIGTQWLFILSLGGVAAYWFRWAMFLLDDSPAHPADSVTTNVISLAQYRAGKAAHKTAAER